jgi:hypothetical protein
VAGALLVWWAGCLLVFYCLAADSGCRDQVSFIVVFPRLFSGGGEGPTLVVLITCFIVVFPPCYRRLLSRRRKLKLPGVLVSIANLQIGS